MMDNEYYIGYLVANLADEFENLGIRTNRKRNKHYDQRHFPKSEIVRTYTNQSPNRFTWVLHPNQLVYNWYIPLIPNTNQFNNVVRPFMRSNIHIQQVFKISNKYMERQFELKKEQKEMLSEVTEYTMYHFTTEDNVDSIIFNNFNWRLSGQSRGHKYGYGMSFSPSPQFAEQFCKNKLVKIVFVVKVLVGASKIGSPDMKLPEHGYDTTISPKKTVFVKFEDSEFFPEYLIYYVKAT